LITSKAQETSSADGSLKNRRSLLRDRLINSRQSFLDLVTGSDSSAVLNEINQAGSGEIEEGFELAAELKRFLDMAKLDAMDDQGYLVDYDRLKKSQAYNEYRQECSPRLGLFDPESLSSPEERLAFWINLYNALVMDGVITSGVTQSVGSNPLSLLAFFHQTAYKVGGKRMSCDDIEHPMLPGAQFTFMDYRQAWIIDPVEVRIHFALNCASRSCPPIQVYTAESLEEQLDLSARNFVNQDVQLDLEKRQLHLSSIFKWYEKDFGGREGVLDFLVAHLANGERRDWLRENDSKVNFRYKAYDWGLNSKKLGFEG
jgi:hypothetical protein